MSPVLLLLAAGAYLMVLFAVAWWGDRRAEQGRYRQRPLTLAMAMAVYATSWTYFGAVGQAAESTWGWLPIYLGPVLVFVFGQPVLRRIVVMAKEHNITSLADFVAVRYGGDARIGAVITLIAVLAILPYMALQLKAVVSSFQVLAPQSTQIDVALLTAAGLGFFAVLFGTRHVAANERQNGLVLAVAFESVIKLSAFVIVAVSAIGLSLPPVELAAAPVEKTSFSGISFVINTLLAGCAIICLPRQFHLVSVESEGVDDLRTARWVLPLYLIAVSTLIVPVARKGAAVLGADVDADTYLLQLPMAAGDGYLALLGFIGGFSAATAMVIVSSIALAIMVSNEWVMPRLLKGSRWSDRQDLGRVLVNVRRFAIVGLLIGSYLFYQWMAAEASLAATGMISFVGIAQLAPAVFGALYWRSGNRTGVLSGLVVGMLVWIYTLLLPAFYTDAPWLHEGPWGFRLLAPYGLLGLTGLDPVSHATVWSLALHVLVAVLVSNNTRTSLLEHFDSQRFEPALTPRSGRLRVADLQVVVERFYGAERARSWLQEFARSQGDTALPRGMASDALITFIEQRLAAAMGSSTARSLLSALYSGSSEIVREVARAIEQASGVARFNRDLLQATLDSLSQAVSVVDAEQRLVAWNHSYERLFQLPDDMLAEGESIERILRYNAERGWLGDGDAEESIQRRLQHLRSHTAYRHERRMPDGRVLDVRGDPMPGGGFVTTFTDITDFIHVRQELERANLTLEQRVSQRTQALEEANAQLQVAQAAAESANRSKTRFLAAAGHDLMQPLNAARLFIASANQTAVTDTRTVQESLLNAERSLQSMESLLSDLLDISKLDAGVWEVRPQPVCLADILDPLCRECTVVAESKNIGLRIRQSRVVVESDPALLRRILQNFLSNALRYTQQGRILLGVRRRGEKVRVEVWDTGPGIKAEDRKQIFEEFARLTTDQVETDKGFGLGLAICARMARLLGHRIIVHSTPGRGSCFALELNRSRSRPVPVGTGADLRTRQTSRLVGMRVLCIDNDIRVLAAMRALLESWGCEVRVAATLEDAMTHIEGWLPQVILADYQLDDGVVGVDVVRALRVRAGQELAAILVTAENSEVSTRDATAAKMRVLRKPVKPAALRALLSRLL